MSAKIVINETGEILYSEGDIDAVYGIASLSKVWAIILLHEVFKSKAFFQNISLDNILDQKIKVAFDYQSFTYDRLRPRPDLTPPDDPLVYRPFRAEKYRFRLPVEEGKSYSVRELFEASLFKSKNDAAQALTDHFFAPDGNNSFRKASFFLANKLGLNKTMIGDPHGLCDGDNISTARELGKICTYIIQENILDLFRKFDGNTLLHTSDKLLKDSRLIQNNIQILMSKTATGNDRQGNDSAESLMVISKIKEHIRSIVLISDENRFESAIELLTIAALYK